MTQGWGCSELCQLLKVRTAASSAIRTRSNLSQAVPILQVKTASNGAAHSKRERTIYFSKFPCDSFVSDIRTIRVSYYWYLHYTITIQLKYIWELCNTVIVKVSDLCTTKKVPLETSWHPVLIKKEACSECLRFVCPVNQKWIWVQNNGDL